MRAEKPSSQNRASKTKHNRRKYLFAVAALVCFGLGMATLLPWNASIPNRAGYYTLCSYAPTSSVALFVAGFSFLFYRNRRMFFISAIFLELIFAYTQYYVYALQMPIDSLQVTLSVYSVRSYNNVIDNEVQNDTYIYFNLTIHNPSNEQTPPFEMDISNISVNGKELVPPAFQPGMAGGVHYFPSYEPIVLKPGENYTYDSGPAGGLELELQMTQVLGANFTSMWSAISQGNVNLTFSGLLVSRIPGISGDQFFLEPNDLYRASEPMGLDFVFLPLNLAVTSFTVSGSHP